MSDASIISSRTIYPFVEAKCTLGALGESDKSLFRPTCFRPVINNNGQKEQFAEA